MFDRAIIKQLMIIGLLLVSTQVSAKTTSIRTGQMNGLWAASAPLNQLALAGNYPFEQCFKQAAKKTDIPVEILLALARGESNFNSTAKSKSNAYGVMQILWPSTARHLGITSLTSLLKPCNNIDAGARYLKEMLSRYDGNLHLAMAAYNYGPGRIKPSMSLAGMPNGAIWYSQYIYDHYQSIVKRQAKNVQNISPDNQTPENQSWQYYPNNQQVLLTFDQAYRAKGFTDYMKQKNPSLKIEWFKTLLSQYQVVLRYDDQQELDRSRYLLNKQGFRF